MLDKKVRLSVRALIVSLLMVVAASLVSGYFIGRDNGEKLSLTGCVPGKEVIGYLKEIPPGVYHLKNGEKVIVEKGLYYSDTSSRSLVNNTCTLLEEVKVWDKYDNKYRIYRAWVHKAITVSEQEGSDLAKMPNP